MNELTDEREPSLPEMLAIAERYGDDAARRLEPDERVLYGAWGSAWLLGFLALWLTAGEDPRVDAARPAGWLFAGLMVAAVVVTIVHVSRRVSGLHGPSVEMGRRYSAAWSVAFVTYGLVLAGLERAGATGEVADLVPPLLACFIVAMLYMAGGAVFGDRLQFRIGVWISLCVGAGAVAGAPAHFLVLGLGGGGGLLAGGLVAHRRVVLRG